MITVLIKYKGINGSAAKFAKEMQDLGLVAQIRQEEGNLGYEYFKPYEDEKTVLLVDRWVDQGALDKHHALPLMGEIAKLREKYDLHMEVLKLTEIKDDKDAKFIRK